MEWGTWFDQQENRRVAHDVIGNTSISTVFLGLDHGFGQGLPVLWETMVFGGPLDEEQERYTSREAAETGHRLMVDRVKAAQRTA
jgi:hypothetical protein